MKVEIFQDSKGEHRFRFLAGNHRIVAVGEGYTRKNDAARAAKKFIADVSTKPKLIAITYPQAVKRAPKRAAPSPMAF